MNAITYKKLSSDTISCNLLNDFNRYQEVKRCWRKENKQWVLKDIPFIDDWNPAEKHDVTMELLDCVNNNGFVFGAFLENKLIGFASLAANFFGHNNEYLEMPVIYVSSEHRGKGIGKTLFSLIVKSAISLGAKKIYISAHSAEESQAFYRAIGCVEAEEINQASVEKEPCDCQLEFVI